MPLDTKTLSPAIKALVLEAAGEGAEGMKRVAKVLHSRALLPRWKGMTVDQIAEQPKQFSGMARTDREAFLKRQPAQVTDQATKAMTDAQTELKGKPWADHYMTQALYDGPLRPLWANKMKIMERHGGHVFLKE